jgi:hypothetical protein
VIKLLPNPKKAMGFHDFDRYERLLTVARKRGTDAYLMVLDGRQSGLEPLEKFGDILDTRTGCDERRTENPSSERGWLATRSSRNPLRQPTFALRPTVGTVRLTCERRVERATGIEPD